MLGLMAQKMFFDPADPKQRHPNAYQRMLEVINIFEPEQYRARLVKIKIPFNCTEKDGFRDAPWRRPCMGINTTPSAEQMEKLQTFKAEREQYQREKAMDQRAAVNQSRVSLGSLASMSSLSKPHVPNYQTAQARHPHGKKIDFDRDRVSAATL